MKTNQAKHHSALAILAACHADIGQDFDTLRGSQIDTLLEYADAHNYHKPKNANGSRARYFFARLQRLAQAK